MLRIRVENFHFFHLELRVGLIEMTFRLNIHWVLKIHMSIYSIDLEFESYYPKLKSMSLNKFQLGLHWSISILCGCDLDHFMEPLLWCPKICKNKHLKKQKVKKNCWSCQDQSKPLSALFRDHQPCGTSNIQLPNIQFLTIQTQYFKVSLGNKVYTDAKFLSQTRGSAISWSIASVLHVVNSLYLYMVHQTSQLWTSNSIMYIYTILEERNKVHFHDSPTQ
jgi:hypothetical protein